MNKEVKYAYPALVFGVIAVSTAAILVKTSLAPAAIIAAYRMFFTVLILGIPTMVYHRKEFQGFAKSAYIYSALAGIFLALHFITWFESLKYTSVASSVVLVNLHPLFSMLGVYILFKERVTKLGLIGALLALIGSSIIGFGDFKGGGQAIFGDLLAIFGAVFVTGYWLVGQSIRKRLSILPYTFLVYSSSVIVLFAYNLLFQNKLFPYENREWLIYFALAIFPTIFGHTVFNWAIRYVNATTVSVTILAEPIGASILAYIFLHEAVSWTQIIGILIIFTGISIYFKYK